MKMCLKKEVYGKQLNSARVHLRSEIQENVISMTIT